MPQRVGVRPRDRHARQAGQPRLGPLEVVGRLPLEVRPDGHRSAARARTAESRAAWKTACSCCTSTWAARSPTSARSRRAVIEAARVYVELQRAGAGLELPGRRRRPGRRLRRLADRFRIERQLHAAGIRQRRRLSHPERLRRSRSAASDHRLRERPRDRRLSQRAGVQRAGRHRLRRSRDAARSSRRTSSSR